MKKLSPNQLREHMRSLGQSKSEKKQAASRANGKLGGRPKKAPNAPANAH